MTCSNRKIVKIIKKYIPFKIKHKSHFFERYITDLGIDSLIYIEVLVALEKHFNITFPEEYLFECQNPKVKDLCVVVKKLKSIKE